MDIASRLHDDAFMSRKGGVLNAILIEWQALEMFGNLLCYHKSNCNKNTNERRENPNKEKRLNLLTLPQLYWSLTTFNEREFHDVKHEDKLHDGQDGEKGTKWKPNP